jgi:hypothetical protein
MSIGLYEALSLSGIVAAAATGQAQYSKRIQNFWRNEPRPKRVHVSVTVGAL